MNITNKLLKSIINNRRNILFALSLLFCCLINTYSFGQGGKLTGFVKDAVSKEPILNASVKLFQKGERKGAAKIELDGSFVISAIDPGAYSLTITCPGYDTLEYENIIIESDKTSGPITFKLNLVSSEKSVTGPIVITGDHRIIGYNWRPGNPPMINISKIVLLTPGATEDGNGNISMRGSRPGTIKYYEDGQPVGYGAPSLPRNAIASIDIIAGGMPAEYGDLTGGVVNITTIGPSAKYSGGFEALSSQFIDNFGYNQFEGSLTGPILKNPKDPSDAILGFALSGNYTHNDVSNPPAIDIFRVKDNVLADIKQNPIRQSPLGEGYVSNASFVTLDQMVRSRIQPNTASGSYAFTGKLEIKPTDMVNIVVGGSLDHSDRNAYYNQFSMFNFDNNPQVIDNNYRAYARFRQRFKSDSNALIRDAYYTVQFSYSSHDQTTQDSRLKDNYFGYGYLGSFDRRYSPIYNYVKDSVNGKAVLSNFLQGYQETSVRFTPGGLNPDAENYTSQFFNLHGGQVPSFTQVQSQGGLLNGQSPSLVYSLWAAPGTNYGSYNKNQQEEYNLTASGTATINKSHTIKFGIEYQQNISRSFNVGGAFGTNIEGLWTLARQLLNSHLTQLDKSNPVLVYSNGSFTDTINYNYQVAAGAQTNFDKNFRNYLINQGARDADGRLVNQQTIINLDQYKPSDLKLSYFSPDELLSNGHSYVNTYGYDYNGNKIANKQSIDDFLNPLKRSESAYNPIYTAGYIQDKFELKDIKFNIGLRVDRFDANQKVLNDAYSLFPVKTAGEVNSIGGVPVSHPGNIGSNYAVYVDDINNPTKITGYRSGSTWYDANGAEEADPKQIAQQSRTGTIAPLLEDRNQKVISNASFKDYVPQVNLMPRVSFSFPISDEANFYANYNVLTIRPSNNFGALDYYYYIETRSTSTLPNPDLKPEMRTNYEIGFQQKIGSDAFLNLNAYYGQIKDLVQLVKYNYAFPVTYTSYGNVDFGTVKGLSVGLDTRHPYEHPYSGVVISANYTLQFADGTGSGSTSAGDLVSAGFPNLRTTFPLDYDTRHQVNCVIDYRFGNELDYQGPVNAKGEKWLKDAGINLVMTAKSGNPYTAQANVTPDVEIGIANRSTIVGTVNGERMPWQFKADLKFDKNFRIATGNDKKPLVINAYVQVQNLLDAKNIVSVYRATGLPDQDGYLQSAAGKSEAANSASQQAFIDQYNIKLNDPSNYIAPRFIRIGASINF